MQIKTEAFSEDGYIINQHELSDIPYGRRTSKESGCGWIAAFNFLRAIGRDAHWPYIHMAFAGGGLGRGVFGTGPFRLYRFLKRQELPTLRCVVGRKQALRQAGDGLRAGVLLYRHRTGLHYVAFKQEGEGVFRFFNAMPGNARHVESMEDFLRTHTKAWPILLMAA